MSPPSDFRSASRKLTEIFDRDDCFESKAADVLELGIAFLDADNGHLTRIDTETDNWEAKVSTDGPDGQFHEGLELDLGKTYCRRTIRAESPVRLHDAPEQGWETDPAYEEHGLHCYHGTVLRIDGDVYGTVCFVGVEARSEPFGETETAFAELLTQRLEQALETVRYENRLTKQTTLVSILNRVLRHNLRNDMTVIRASLKRMQEHLGGDEFAQKGLDKVDELIGLSRQARDLERIVNTEFSRREVNLVATVAEVAERIGADHPSATITVESDERVTAEVSPYFERAIRELLLNAAEHGGPSPTVTVTVEYVPNAVEVRVRDDGPGLPEMERDVLGTAAESPLTHGDGLGLWVVQHIVDSHDGELTASVDDAGTTMTVSVPHLPEVTLQSETTAFDPVRVVSENQ